MSESASQTSRLVRAPVATRRYRVFLSYSHSDTRWARWLMRRLEGYSVPTRLHGRTAPIGEVGKRIAPVFRDRDELPTTSDLGEEIRGALREAATLVVICSPASARSRWVQEEIATFKHLHGERTVFAFIVSGEPKFAGAPDDCFSPALRMEVGADGTLSGAPAEVVAADARREADGPKLAFVRLVAGLLGVGFDELRQRELQRRNRKLVILATSCAVGMAFTLGLATVAWRARNDARRRQEQAEDVLGFMLGNFRSELKKLGRMDLLDQVGDKAMEYFEHLDPRDLTDTAAARHAKAFTQIGEIRMEQKDARYGEAARAFVAGYERASSLAKKHPDNADMLFERAQAEFGIGFIHWKRRDYPQAIEWLSRYRDSAAKLSQIEGPTLRARREVISAHHNLAALELATRHVTNARDGFVKELALHRELLADTPDDRQIAFRIADTYSWLGTTAETAGDLLEARRMFSQQVNALDELVVADPKTAHWRYKLADSKVLFAIMLTATGEQAEAAQQLGQAQNIVSELLKVEPANRRWQILAHTVQLQILMHDQPRWRDAETIRAAVNARVEIEKLSKAEPTDISLMKLLSRAWRLEAGIRAASSDPGAIGAAQKGIELAEALLVRNSQPDIRGGCAEAYLRAAVATRDSATARMLCEKAWAAAQPDAAASWVQLDAAARALALLGRTSEHEALVARLRAMGYRPAEPWPLPIRS